MNKFRLNKALCITMLSTVMVFTGCSGDSDETTKNVDIKEVKQEVAKAYGDEYVPEYTFDEQYIEEVFGLSSDLYDEIIAEGPKVSFDIDTFIAVKAKEGKGEDVQKILDEYRQSQIDDAMQYPENAIKIQASTVTRHGDYVFYTCLGVISDKSKEAGDDAILSEAKEDNKIAVDTINKCFE